MNYIDDLMIFEHRANILTTRFWRRTKIEFAKKNSWNSLLFLFDNSIMDFYPCCSIHLPSFGELRFGEEIKNVESS